MGTGSYPVITHPERHRLLETADVFIVTGAFFFAAFVKGVTGLGFSTTAMPFLVYALGIKVTLPMLIIPSVASNLIVMRDAGHFRPTLHRFRWLYVSALPGIVLGLTLLNWLDPGVSSAVLGLVLILYCAVSLVQPGLQLPAPFENLEAPFGFTTGVINGFTGSQVLPVLPFLLPLPLSRDQFIRAHQHFVHPLQCRMALGLFHLGLFTLASIQGPRLACWLL
ncbi:MAG: hypothetical protein Ct9H300mP16_03730 [Pseudomonadota bacterium]|nr:MAG: hypothetical protein Ct9H300mP16_03730 [Pseudomonadota bacterium]